MNNLYVKTLFVYLMILLVFLITVLVWDFFFVLFVLASAFVTKRRSLVVLSKEDLTLPYGLYHVTLMIATVVSLFFIVRAVL